MLKFKLVICLAGLVGLIGGFLFGVWDSITVIIDRGLAHYTIREMFTFSLYSVSIYTVIGCLGMVIIGVASSMVIKTGKYRTSKLQLARVFIGVFVLLAVSVLLANIILFGNIIDVTEGTVISVFSGAGVAALSIYAMTYVLGRGMREEKLIALCISLFVSIIVLLYSGLLVNIKLLSAENFYQPFSLLANIGLLILVILMGAGIYVLSLLIMQRSNPRRTKQAGYTLLSIILCAFIAISFIGPFNSSSGNLVSSGDLNGKPNILWIVMDTVRADHLSCYGYYRNTTPNIDRIASEGVLFENAISAAPWTLPSHASMFTGMFPSKHGTDAEHHWLEDDFQTIAEVLRLNDYSTFAFSNNWFVHSRTNLSQGFDTYEWTNAGKIEAESELVAFLKVSVFKRYVQNTLLKDSGAHRTNRIVKEWIADAHKAGIPFFIFINYMEAHHPYHPPGDYATLYLGTNVSNSKALSVTQDSIGYMMGKVQISNEEFGILRALYDGEISYLDFKMGQLLNYLRELNILNNTILIITSDHGENFGEHHMMEHQLCIYDTLLHVPLIIRYPRSFEAGLRIKEQVQTTDIFPTILDIAGINWDGEEQLQGCSLLKNREQRKTTFVIAEYATFPRVLDSIIRQDHKLDTATYVRRLKTIRTEEFKYIWASDGRDELYNIRIDPDELNNLIDTEPEKAREMRELLIEWLNSFELYRPEAAKQVR